MANGLYDKGREGFLDGSIDWDTDDIRTALYRTSYNANLGSDQFLSTVTPANLAATMSSGMTGKTVTAGVADADDVTFAAVSGTTVEGIVIYKWTGSDATSRLIANIDTATGIPFVPSGGSVTITWDSGANKIFKL